MRIEQLRFFVEIAKSNSFSLAAERLHVTQPSVSQAISKLEEELNVKLFNRSRTGAHLTKAGNTLLPKVQNVLNMIDEIQDEARVESQTLAGHLLISAIPSMCTAFLTKVLSVYKKKHPKVHIEVKEEGTNQVLKDVLSNQVDIGLISCLPEDQIDKMENIEFKQLLSGTYMACIGKYSSVPLYNPIPPEIITKHPLITFKPSYRQNKYLKKVLKTNELNVLFTFGNTEVAKKLISEGVAIGFYPDFSIQRDAYVRSGEIFPLEIKDNDVKLMFGWIRPKNRYFSKAAQEFIRILKRVIDA